MLIDDMVPNHVAAGDLVHVVAEKPYLSQLINTRMRRFLIQCQRLFQLCSSVQHVSIFTAAVELINTNDRQVQYHTDFALSLLPAQTKD